MKYKLITILRKNNESIEKEDYSDSKLTFSGNFVVVEKPMGDYSTIIVINLEDIDKIRTYNKIEETWS